MRSWSEVKEAKAEIDHENGRITMDDVRRKLEALGFTHGTDRLELEQVALDAYGEVWEPSQKLVADHKRALLHAIAACAELINNQFNDAEGS